MTAGDRAAHVEREVVDEEPIEVGWYAYSGGAQTMIFHLHRSGQWSVHLDNGTAADCAWGYIEQALGVWDLVRIDPLAALPQTGDAAAVLADDWESFEWQGPALDQYEKGYARGYKVALAKAAADLRAALAAGADQ